MKKMKLFFLISLILVITFEVYAAPKIKVPDGSSLETQTYIQNMKPGEVDPALWSQLATYKYGDESYLPLKLEAAISIAGIKNNGKIEAKILKVFDSKKATSDGKQLGCRMLQRVGSEKCVPTLTGYLNDEKLSHFSRIALERLDNAPSALNALRKALPKVSDKLKPGIIGSISETGNEKDIQLISKYLIHKNNGVALTAIKALGKIGGTDSLKALEKTKVSEPLENYRLDAMMLCAERSGDISVFKMIYNDKNNGAMRISALRGMLVKDPNGTIPILIGIIKGEESFLRQGILNIIMTDKNKKLTVALAGTLKDITAEKRIEMIEALIERGDSSVMDKMATYLNSKDKKVRQAAIMAAGVLGNADNIKTLLKITKEKEFRETAQASLEGMTDPKVDNVLINLLKDKDLIIESIQVLGIRQARSAVPTILDLLKDKNPEVRKEAWKILPNIASEKDIDNMMKNIIKIKERKEKTVAEKSLKKFSSLKRNKKEIFDIALKYYSQASEPIKFLILDLGAIAATPEALKLVQKEIKSDKKSIHDKAVRALAAWSDPGASQALLKLVQNGSPEIEQILALRGYIRLIGAEWNSTQFNNKEEQEERLKMILEADKHVKKVDEKRLLLGSIKANTKGLKGLEILNLLDKYLDDPEVQEEAAQAALDIAKRNNKNHPDITKKMGEKMLKVCDDRNVQFHAKKLAEGSLKKDKKK